MSLMHESSSTVKAALGYAAVLIVLFHRLFLGESLHPGANINSDPPFFSERTIDHVPYCNNVQGDIWRQHAAWEKAQYQAAQQGRFPFWNPYVYCGFPLHANGQSAFFHPFHWVFFVVDPNIARGPMALLRLWVSALAMYALLRRQRLSVTAAFIGGLVWMLAGYNIRWLLWPVSNAPLWLPVLLLTLDRFLDRPTRRRFAVAGMAATVLQLAGHPETQYLAGLVAGGFVAVRLSGLAIGGSSWSAIIGSFLGSVAVMIVGVFGAAAAVLPFLCQMVGSSDWIEGAHGGHFRVPLEGLWLFLAPDHFGRPRALHQYVGPSNYIELCGWFGMPSLALALTAVCTRRWWRTDHQPDSPPASLYVFGILTFAAAALLAHGAPMALAVFHALPLGRQTGHLRLFFAVNLAGAILTALGVHHILSSRNRTPAIVAAVWLLCGVAATFWLLWNRHWGALAEPWNDPEWIKLVHQPAMRIATGVLLGIAAFAVLVGIAGSKRRHTVLPRSWKWGLVSVLAVDMLWVAWDFNPTAPIEIADPPPPPIVKSLVELAGDNRATATGVILSPNLSMNYGFRDVRGYDWPIPARLGRVLDALHLSTGVTDIPASQVQPVLDLLLATWFDRCSVQVILTQSPALALAVESTADVSTARQAESWPAVVRGPQEQAIYRNPNAYPRAFVAEAPVIVDADQAAQAFLDPTRDLLRHPVVEGSLPKAEQPASGTVTFIDDGYESVTLSCQSATGGLVVLNDSMSPGWSVTVDGQPQTPLTVNYLFRGVWVGPGQHTIQWTYVAPGFRTGAITSLITLTVLLLLTILGRGASAVERPASERTTAT